MSDHDEPGILDRLRCPTCRRFPSEPTTCPDPCHTAAPLAAEDREPTALEAAAEAVIALVPLRTHTPERWMANRDERSRAAIAELRRLVEAVR